MRRSIVVCLVFFTAFLAEAQERLTVDHIMRGRGLVGWEPESVRWSADSKQVYFLWKQATDPIEKEPDTYVVNRDGSGLRKLSEEEAKNAPPLRGFKSKDKKRTLYAEDGDIFLYDAATGKRRNLTKTTESESNPRFTKDERRVTFVRSNNLYVLSLSDGSVIQLTNIAGPDDKGPNVSLWDEKKSGSDTQEFVKKEERELLDIIERRAKKREEDEAKRKRENPRKPFKLERRQTVTDLQLTPDEQKVIAFLSVENEKAKRTIVPTYVTESAYTDTLPAREKVGDSVSASRMAVLDVTTGEVKWFEHGLKQIEKQDPKKLESETKATESEQAPPEKRFEASAARTEKSEPKDREVSVGPIVWSDDGARGVLALRARDNKDRWIIAFDPATAKGRIIATQHDDAWVNFAGSNVLGFLADSKTIYFISEETGYLHLYTAPHEGGGVTPLTSGRWEVTGVALSDDKKFFYLTTSEETPYERHLYRMAASGGERTKLTTMKGNNDSVVAPDNRMQAVVYSYTNKPPELYLQSIRGGEPKKVTSAPGPDFWQYSWLDVPIVEVPARDGARVPARIYKPANYNSGRAVIFVHGAGYLQNVHRWWSTYFREYMFHHLLMERGYLVLDIDYRASSGYGRDWRTAIYRHMGGKDLDDHVDAARWLVNEHGVDANKIGIYGGSYGGFITLMALFTQPDVFAAGAALRPVTDWAHYNHPYTSNILNTPAADPEAYRRSSPIYFAEGLKKPLLMCHGLVDVNVHAQDTIRLAQKLIELRKENWEMALYPIEDHSFVEPTSWADEYKRILNLFEKYLR